MVTRVKVVTGDTLSLLDTTGTLTQKYQARLIPSAATAELVSKADTARLALLMTAGAAIATAARPTDQPSAFGLLPIQTIFDRLRPLVSSRFQDRGRDQERNRGGDLHRLICEHLGYRRYQDDGQFPDIRNQLLEAKLQTSPTIDLGLICPNSKEPLDVPKLRGSQIRHCDVRYALFCGATDGRTVTLTHFFLTTGADFFNRFPQFQGKILNKKLQIRLPDNFFTG